MLLPIFVVLALTALFPSNSVAKEITIQPGDTLSGIADRYKISVVKLKQVNGIDNPNQLKAGAILKLPNNESLQTDFSNPIHTVVHGETLSEIANKYAISQREIIELNNIQSANHLNLGQKLLLPNPHYKEEIKKVNYLTDQRSIDRSSFHIVSQGETLSSISKTYNISLQDLILINSLKNPNEISSGTKLSLMKSSQKSIDLTNDPYERDPKLSLKPKYGPIQIDWRNSQMMNGSHVMPTTHTSGQSFFLAVNCSFRRLNITGENGEWQEWTSPVEGFEYDLINDRCN